MPQIGASQPPDADPGDKREREEMEIVRDVLVIPSPGYLADPGEWREHRPVDGRVNLGNGVMLERLRPVDGVDIAEQVIQASVPRGLNFEPTRSFGQLYSFWREVPREEWSGQGMFNWDTALAIAEVVVISRLVLDNGHGYEFAGRVFDHNDENRRIAPLNGYEGRTAYRARKSRFWYTTPEADELRTLLDQYRAVKGALPDRVSRALQQAERSAQSHFITDAVTHVVTGLEALLNTNEDAEITKQFVKRSKQLADELGIDTSNTYWSWVYKKRSEVVHGAESKLVAPAGWYESEDDPPADVKKISKAQEVLRAAVRRAIEADKFRAVFESDDAIAARWPLQI